MHGVIFPGSTGPKRQQRLGKRKWTLRRDHHHTAYLTCLKTFNDQTSWDEKVINYSSMGNGNDLCNQVSGMKLSNECRKNWFAIQSDIIKEPVGTPYEPLHVTCPFRTSHKVYSPLETLAYVDLCHSRKINKIILYNCLTRKLIVQEAGKSEITTNIAEGRNF